jgi:hypothetical protein
VGETRVDLLHLLEDLRDAYPGATEETILTEVVANSLDSGATSITVLSEPARSTLTIVDDGRGMRRRELSRYHDVAATTKAKGEGIGFAGVGIKIGLLVSTEVLTESRSGKSHVATTWSLTSRHRAPWRWLPPPGLLANRGTAVRLALENPLSPLLDPGFVEATLRRHFRPLLEPGFDEILGPHYPRGVQMVVNGRLLASRRAPATETAPLAVRLARKRKPAVSGYLVRDAGPMPEEDRGLAISTFGKVIKRGWDWLGLTPAAPERVGGMIEAPALAGSLTLNKGDFVRTGPRGAVYLAYRKAIQEAVSRQLALWGDARDAGEGARRRAARPVERDLEAILVDLAEDFPLLVALVEQRAGGQRRLSMARPGAALSGAPAAGPGLLAAGPPPTAPGDAATPGPSPAAPPSPPAEAPIGPEPPSSPAPPAAVEPPARGPRRPGRYALAIQFDARPEDPELGRLVESTVWINEAHPAYRRALASRSEGYHLALAVAMALAQVAVDPAREHAFVTAFLARWGAALGRRRAARSR